jgi:hypothetical protein
LPPLQILLALGLGLGRVVLFPAVFLARLILLTARVPLALLVAATPATLAATKNASGEAVYRCRDARGQSHFGQAIPEKCLDQDVEVRPQELQMAL